LTAEHAGYKVLAEDNVNKTILKHGCHSQISGFSITQHFYAGAETGFIELLEIHDAPSDKNKFVFCEYNMTRDGQEYAFAEFDSLENAKRAQSFFFSFGMNNSRLSKLPGFKRFVECSKKKWPWFYADDRAKVYGDFVKLN
jgi:hypothetical protein